MRIAGQDIVRIRGTVTLELSDGREGTLEVDLDVSSPTAALLYERIYDERDRHGALGIPVCYATKYGIQLPFSVITPEPDFKITLPVEEAPA